MENQKDIDKARQTLKQAGYYVGNLWSIQDVMEQYECTEDEAQEVLDRSLTNEATIEQIQFSIREFAEVLKLKEKS
jgi:hypothetical protein